MTTTTEIQDRRVPEVVRTENHGYRRPGYPIPVDKTERPRDMYRLE